MKTKHALVATIVALTTFAAAQEFNENRNLTKPVPTLTGAGVEIPLEEFFKIPHVENHPELDVEYDVRIPRERKESEKLSAKQTLEKIKKQTEEMNRDVKTAVQFAKPGGDHLWKIQANLTKTNPRVTLLGLNVENLMVFARYSPAQKKFISTHVIAIFETPKGANKNTLIKEIRNALTQEYGPNHPQFQKEYKDIIWRKVSKKEQDVRCEAHTPAVAILGGGPKIDEEQKELLESSYTPVKVRGALE